MSQRVCGILMVRWVFPDIRAGLKGICWVDTWADTNMESCKTLTYAVTVLSCYGFELFTSWSPIKVPVTKCKIRLRMLRKADPFLPKNVAVFPKFLEEKRDKVKAEPREPREPPNEAQVPLFQLHLFCRDLDGYDRGSLSEWVGSKDANVWLTLRDFPRRVHCLPWVNIMTPA